MTQEKQSGQRKAYAPEQKLKIVLESFQSETATKPIRIKYGVEALGLHRWRE